MVPCQTVEPVHKRVAMNSCVDKATNQAGTMTHQPGSPTLQRRLLGGKHAEGFRKALSSDRINADAGGSGACAGWVLPLVGDGNPRGSAWAQWEGVKGRSENVNSDQ
eukprot:Skav215110  [mRNA]  locus=scaffold1893:127888:128208:+ [translate_table: standard]